MERIKAICNLILYSSAIIFCTTFVDAIYPKGLSESESYDILIEQYQKILDNSSIEEKDAASFLSEEEFSAHIDRNVVIEKVQTALENNDLYRITLEDEQQAEISEQFAKLYDQQIAAQENIEYSASMRMIRLVSILLALLSVAIILVLNMKMKSVQKNIIDIKKDQ